MPATSTSRALSAPPELPSTVSSASSLGVLLVLVSLVAASGCARQSTDLAPAPRDESRAVAPARTDAPGATAAPFATSELAQAPVGPSTVNAAALPEDPEAGKRAEAQWREHLEEEEEGRQLGFDRRRLKQHRALIKRIKATRVRVNGARTLSAITKVQGELPAQIALLRHGIEQIDPWGATSRLLPDYNALLNLLAGDYCEAKAEALRGHPAALAEANKSIDEHLKLMEQKLEQAAESEEEY
jgi:hypothetical protein